MLLVRFLVNIYYVVICAWCMVYLGTNMALGLLIAYIFMLVTLYFEIHMHACLNVGVASGWVPEPPALGYLRVSIYCTNNTV